jgi:pimeloyl-ACP methyl ester carboxylesterase
MSAAAPRSRKYYLRLAEFGLVILLVLLYFGYPVVYAFNATRPSPSTTGAYSPLDFGQPYVDILLTAQDGMHLSGWYIPSKNKAAVILLHGYGSNRLNMFVHAEILARHGYGVLLYDARASGQSEGDRRSYGWQDLEDVIAAIEYLQTQPDVDPERIGIAGISTGAEVALGAAARYPGLAAVLADGAGFPVQADIPPPASLEDYYMKPLTPIMFALLELLSGVHAPRALTTIIQNISPRPILLVSTGTGLEKRQAEIYYQLAGSPKDHWNLPKSSHGHGIFTNRAEYEQRMIQFFENGLMKK